MKPDIAALADAVGKGQRRVLAQAITLAESSRRDHQEQAARLLECLLPRTGQAFRIGISGAPGVGKSTFIEALGLYLIAQGQKIAVLSIDPSSSISGGSILGDKTRMGELARHSSDVYIRPSPAGRTLGGVARRSRETLLLVEAAGFDIVIVETVGVGQSETVVAEMTDMFVLLMLPSAGDELQGIKRGIMELADLILINKADGELLQAAQRACSDYRNALRLLQPRSPNWRAQVELCSALQGSGIEHAWSLMQGYRDALSDTGELAERRARQALAWLWSEVNAGLLSALERMPRYAEKRKQLEQQVAAGRLPPTVAARQLLDLFFTG